MVIKKVRASEILDSRGVPTISTKLWLEDGSIGRFDVPSGASTGENEVLELRDGDKSRYFGMGMLKAVDIVNNEIAKFIVDKNFNSQEELDKYLIELDGTKQKTRLGGNSILSVSIAFCKAQAKSKGVEVYQHISDMLHGTISYPIPRILIMEGGTHGNWCTDFQEYMIVPNKEKFPKTAEMLRGAAEVFHATKDVLLDMSYGANVGFEGAYCPKEIKSNEEAFDIILKGIERAGYKPDVDFKLAIDCAASEFFNKERKRYELKREGIVPSSGAWLEKALRWFSQYPICSVEDPFDQADWETWGLFTAKVGDKYEIVGDDLLTTNVSRIKKAVSAKACNSVLIKVNQIGTLTETLEAIKLAKENNLKIVISHRGGETNDDFIADLAVGTGAGQCKFGGPDRGERLAKYLRLIEIENANF
ncbi:phosphopyruvate hydratase [Candidatus Dojkabacteria bacterium]|jgi:enolase|nr:phosphopyruvate hydratase [Candidatus Dojkabacteria bacterium]